MVFDGTEKEIGKGSQAIIYYYKGYAYKVFNEGYPNEYIDGEFYIQNQINKTDLNTVKYYKTEYTNILKMDYIDGITMAEKFNIDKDFKDNLINMIDIQKKINKIENLELLRINDMYKKFIDESTLDDNYKDTALNYLNEIEDKNNLCHLDFHPLNINYQKLIYH